MNKLNIILGITLLLFTHIAYAQKVGINTNTPQTTLDVNGTMQVRKEIKLGGAAGTAGSPGTAGHAFTSQGAGNSPVWSSMGIDLAKGFSITQSITLNDQVGVIYDQAALVTSLSAGYEENSELSTASGWTEIPGLKSEIIPSKTNNRVVVTLQTVGQTLTNSFTGDLVFQIGIFVDGKLKSTRPLTVCGSSVAFAAGTLFDSFEQLPVKTDGQPYVIQVAVAVRYHNPDLTVASSTPAARDYSFLIGTTNTTATNTTYPMNMTSLKVDLYEEM